MCDSTGIFKHRPLAVQLKNQKNYGCYVLFPLTTNILFARQCHPRFPVRKRGQPPIQRIGQVGLAEGQRKGTSGLRCRGGLVKIPRDGITD
jgi:hypothetical protein